MRGFTLIELMVVIAIMGILLGIAAPAATEWIASQKVRDTAFDIQASLMRARSEAISRGLAVAVTPVGGVWASGWSIANPSYAGKFIDQHGAVASATITGSGIITFNSIGRLQGATAVLEISVLGTTSKRCVNVDASGRAKTKVGACA